MSIEEVSNSQSLTPTNQPVLPSSPGNENSTLEFAINIFGAMGVAATPFLLRGRGSSRTVRPMINRFNSYIAHEFAQYAPRLNSVLFGGNFIPPCVRNATTRFPSFIPEFTTRLPAFQTPRFSIPNLSDFFRQTFNYIRAQAKQRMESQQDSYLFKLMKASRLPIQAFMEATIRSIKQLGAKASSSEATSLILFAFASTAFAQYQNRKNAKADDLTVAVNSRIAAYQEVGKELSLLLREQQQKREEATLALKDEIRHLIEQFPEEERENILLALERLSYDLEYTTEIADLQIQDALQQLAELQALPEPHMRIAKDLSSNLASALVGVGISLSFGRFAFAKDIVQGIIRMGVPETVVNKMLIGVITTGMQEVALLATDQNVTPTDVKKVSDEILKEMGIDPKDKTPLSQEEQQMSHALGDITVSIIAKFMTSMIDNPIVSEMTEAALQQTLQAAVTNVEGYVPANAIEETVKENLKPVEDQINTLSKRVSTISEQGTKKLKKFKQAAQEQLSVIQMQKAEEEQKALQERVQPATTWESVYNWGAKVANTAVSLFRFM